jgi:hypothetical protein
MPYLPVVVSYIRSRIWDPDIIVELGDALVLQQEGGAYLSSGETSIILQFAVKSSNSFRLVQQLTA